LRRIQVLTSIAKEFYNLLLSVFHYTFAGFSGGNASAAVVI